MPSSRQVETKSLCKHSVLLEKKRREKTTPFDVSLMRSQVLYWAAQDSVLLHNLACLSWCPAQNARMKAHELYTS